MIRKRLPIGIDGFEKMRTNDVYYADKTMFLKELRSVAGFSRSNHETH